MPRRFYLTTTLPYINAEPHIGFALEIVQADIIARYHASLGEEIFFNTGTDEHGLKIYRAAAQAGQTPQAYADEYAAKFRNLRSWLGLSEKINFIRTTDPAHQKAAQKFWEICDRNGYIYKRKYQVKYCVGCELEKTESELEEGRCPLHPNLKIELIDEENYFFGFSQFKDKLLKLYADRPDFVLPPTRLNEIRAFVSRGLEDFSISRLASRMPWGVPVPDDPDHVMYVWFDALVNYVSAIGWPDSADFANWWPPARPNGPRQNGVGLGSGGVTQFAGKDNLRQQAAMWQAMLMAANLPPSKQIIIHGFINVAGQKMSKSLGNVIDPIKLVEEYGTDALRYYLARHVHPFEDSDFTLEKFKEAYNADLVNGLGNLVARVMQMASQYLDKPVDLSDQKPPLQIAQWLDKFEFHNVLIARWSNMDLINGLIQNEKPFEMIKTDKEKAKLRVTYYVKELYRIAESLKIFMPETAEKIQRAIRENKKPENLFPRKD